MDDAYVGESNVDSCPVCADEVKAELEDAGEWLANALEYAAASTVGTWLICTPSKCSRAAYDRPAVLATADAAFKNTLEGAALVAFTACVMFGDAVVEAGALPEVFAELFACAFEADLVLVLDDVFDGANTSKKELASELSREEFFPPCMSASSPGVYRFIRKSDFNCNELELGEVGGSDNKLCAGTFNIFCCLEGIENSIFSPPAFDSLTVGVRMIKDDCTDEPDLVRPP
jgi:hypothetical protein